MKSEASRKRVLRMNTDVTSLSSVVDGVLAMSAQKQGGYVCLSNVHMCMETFDSPEFEKVVNEADYVLPDGLPIAVAQKLLKAPGASQVRGQDLMNAVCSVAASKGLKIGLYGGADLDVLKKVEAVLKSQFPGLEVSYTFCPPFRPLTEEEDASVVAEINAAEVDMLFVGIGCPKQERWMAAHKSQLSCVMYGVGAAFDFISGSKKHAPIWMQRAGLEWFFRLCSEPSRLWKRYLQQNPRFIYYFLRQWVFGVRFD